MNSLHTLLAALGLSLAATVPGLDFGAREVGVPDEAQPAVSAAPLMWTDDIIWGPNYNGSWDSAKQNAAAWTEGGYTDWRLPTVLELQTALAIPAGQPGSWGLNLRNPGSTHRGYTSKTQGQWAITVFIATDAAGAVIQASPTGQTSKVLKGSNLAGTKFVRP